MTGPCERCQGKGHLINQSGNQVTCSLCRGVGRRKLTSLDLKMKQPRKS